MKDLDLNEGTAAEQKHQPPTSSDAASGSAPVTMPMKPKKRPLSAETKVTTPPAPHTENQTRSGEGLTHKEKVKEAPHTEMRTRDPHTGQSVTNYQPPVEDDSEGE